MAPNITLSLACLTGRASGVPLEANTVSRYLRLPQIIVGHYLFTGALRIRGRRFETDLLTGWPSKSATIDRPGRGGLLAGPSTGP